MPSIRFRRCYKKNMPTEAPVGEPILVIDTGELWVGQGQGQPLKKISDGIGIPDQNTGHEFKFWQGTQNEYNALATKDPYTIYFIR